jgi:hypothetical protein
MIWQKLDDDLKKTQNTVFGKGFLCSVKWFIKVGVQLKMFHDGLSNVEMVVHNTVFWSARA